MLSSLKVSTVWEGIMKKFRINGVLLQKKSEQILSLLICRFWIPGKSPTTLQAPLLLILCFKFYPMSPRPKGNIRQRQREGIAAAKQKGVRLEGPKADTFHISPIKPYGKQDRSAHGKLLGSLAFLRTHFCAGHTETNKWGKNTEFWNLFPFFKFFA